MDTHLRIQKWIRIRKFKKSRIHGYYLDTKWIQRGYEVDTVWIRIRGYFMDTFWIQRGYRLDMYPRIFYGYILDTKWIQDGYTLCIHSGYISMIISAQEIHSAHALKFLKVAQC